MGWSSLRHAYGEASDVPPLLEAVAAAPDADSEALGELWSRLCHQGTVYSASFAALPTLLEITENASTAQRSELIVLAAGILSSDDVYGGLRDELLPPVEWVRPLFRQLCEDRLSQGGMPWHELLYLLEAALSLDGDRVWGRQLNHLADGEIPGACPYCEADLYLVIGQYGFFATADEWIAPGGGGLGSVAVRSDVRKTELHPLEGQLPQPGDWLQQQALAAGHNDVAEWIAYLFGSTTCPVCDESFALQAAILE